MKKILALSLASAAALLCSAHGQNATTTPVGAMTYTFNATTTSTKTTYHSFPLLAEPVFVGQPTAVNSSTLTFGNATWTSGQFAATPPNYVARVLSGQQAGRLLHVVSNTANSVTLSITDRSSQSTNLDTPGFAVTTSDNVELVPCDTIASLFGDGSVDNPLVFLGGLNILTADTISIFNRTNGKWEAYYFSTVAGQNCWRTSSSAASRNALSIYPDDAISVVRRANRPATTLTLTGRVPTVSPLFKANPNASYATAVGVPVDMPLSGLALAGAWTKGTSVLTADTISLHDAVSGKFNNYYQRSSDDFWRMNTLQTDASTTTISAGSVLFIRERATTLTGASSFNSFPLPYSL